MGAAAASRPVPPGGDSVVKRPRINDYAPTPIKRRNREAAEMLDRVGLGELLERRPGGYHAVPPEFDQQTIAKLRSRFREEASHLLLEEQRGGRHLLACHIVHPAWQAPLGCLTASRLTEPKGWLKRKLAGVGEVTMGVGAVDLSLGETRLPIKRLYWSPHIHVVLAVRARSSAAAKALIRERLAISSDPDRDVLKPLMVKRVTELSGAIDYATKTLIGRDATYTRVVGVSAATGERVSRKVSLRREAEADLVHLMRQLPMPERLIRVRLRGENGVLLSRTSGPTLGG